MKNILNLSIEKIFVILAIFFGFLYVFILPPFQSVDEGNHFFRTYQISEGRFVSINIAPDKKVNDSYDVGDYIPSVLLKYYQNYIPFIKNIDMKQNLDNIKRDFSVKIDKNDTIFAPFANSSLYSPTCYIGSLIGVISAKIFTNNLAVIYYFGRITDLLFYCLLVFWAIKTIPFYKLPLMLLAICPMSLSLASSYTSDVSVLGFNFLWIAYILKFITQDEKDIKKTAILTLLAILITFSKSYVFILPLLFLIPPKKYKNMKNYILSVCCIAFFIVLSGIIWCISSKGLTLNMNDMIADPAKQIAFIISHPITYIWIMIKTFFIKTPRILITMIGVLGWQDAKLDWSTYILYPVLMYFAIFSDSYKFVLNKWQKILIFGTFVLGSVLTYTSLYVMWTPVANGVILGLNGKYFIPMMLPFLLLFKKEYPKFDNEKITKFVLIAVLLILFTSELSLLHRFYNITPQLYYKI